MLKYTSDKKIFGICAALLAAALTLLPFTGYFAASRQVRDDVVRLHVLADSDDEADQRIKLKVRDAVLENASALFGDASDADNAKTQIGSNLALLTQTANSVLEAEGVPYRATAQLTYEYFDTRAYGDLTLPAGRYAALKIVLGSGEGQNWWCVVFPPLCLPAAEGTAAAVFSEDEMTVLRPSEGYRIRFKLAEIAAEIAEKWRKRNNEMNN
ncbi:MAG: stage II sporulation protein R [Clostridia bacterium]|nr:stage II sporulation protein R [Clostridia bacterium]